MTTAGTHSVPSWVRRGRLRWVWGLWEPLDFYRRSPQMAAYSPGNALWAADWYARMHSEEMVTQLAGLGINCITTHYYKGFGLRAEAAEMARAARFTELCHAHGIRVLGYHQWSTLCYETFLDEVPHAKDWVQRDADGKLLLYSGSTYWRWLGCQQHPDYVEYLRGVVRQCLTDARMDGIEWDGTVYECHCELCQSRFREYLETKYAGVDVLPLFGIPHFRHVRIPSGRDRRDPLFHELLWFRRQFMTRNLQQYNDLIKSINPEAAQVTYIFHPAYAEPESAIDILVDENHDICFVQDGQLTTKFRGLKQGFAQDRMVLTTSWLRAPSRQAEPARDKRVEEAAEIAGFGMRAGGLRRPETAAEVQRDLAEDAMYGGHLVTPTWALRSAGGDRAAFETPELCEALRLYLDFFRRHEELYDATASLANVAIYRSHHAVTLDFFSSYPCVAGMEQTCLQHQIPFDMLFSHQLGDLRRYDAIVLAEQTCLSDAEIAAFLRFVEAGGGLVITGRTGFYDERFRHRQTDPLTSLHGRSRVVFLRDAPERLSRPERDHVPAYHDMHLPQRAPEIVSAILQATDGRLPCRVDAGRFVGTDAYRLASGACAIHLLNYANEQPVSDVRISLPAEQPMPQRVQLFSPDCVPQECDLRTSGHAVTVPRLDTYAVLLLE